MSRLTSLMRALDAFQGGLFPYTLGGLRAASNALRTLVNFMGSSPVTRLARAVVQLLIAWAGSFVARSRRGKPGGEKRCHWLMTFLSGNNDIQGII